MTLYKSNLTMQKSDEGSSLEGDDCCSPKVSLGRERLKKKKEYKPIYRNLGIEPLIVEDLLMN
jgi:hypothetical protein